MEQKQSIASLEFSSLLSSYLSINPTFTSSMDYLLGLLRLIHSNCLEFPFHIKKSLHFSSQILSESAEGSIPQTGWEAGVLPPLLPFPSQLLLCLCCLEALRSQQSPGARSSSLVMVLGVPGLLSPRRIHGCPRWVLGSMGAHRAPQLLPTAPLPCLSRVSWTPCWAHLRQRRVLALPCLSQAEGPWPALHRIPACLARAWANAASRIPTNEPIPAHTARSNSAQETIWDPY